MRTIIDVIERAKTVQKVSSDYKLGLCLGIGGNSLSSYRTGRSLPDEKACKILAEAMGEDPALLTVQMQAQRARTPEARLVWTNIAKRLQAGFSSVSLLVLIAIFSIAMTTLPVWAVGVLALAKARPDLPAMYIMLTNRVTNIDVHSRCCL